MMDDDPDLFGDKPHARRSDPNTSHLAAASVRMTAQCIQILKVYATTQYPITDHNAYQLAGFDPKDHARQRCSDLRQKGLIVRTGDCGITPSGKSAKKCQITDAGREWLMRIRR